MQTRLKNQLLEHATSPYRSTSTFNYHWAQGKLGHDPIFAALIEHSVFPDGARILDLGCGRGLLAAWFLAAEQLAIRGNWNERVPPPKNLVFRGVELMAREAEWGNQALQAIYPDRVHLVGGDMRLADLRNTDAIAILDVLHYISYSEQEQLLDRIRESLPDEGILVTRIGNTEGGLRFAISQLVDFGISFAQGHRLSRLWCRSLADWIKTLESRDFVVESHAMSKGTPFSNVMLVCRVACKSLSR